MLVSPTLVTNEADKKQEYKQLLSLRPKIIPSMKEKRKTGTCKAFTATLKRKKS